MTAVCALSVEEYSAVLLLPPSDQQFPVSTNALSSSSYEVHDQLLYTNCSRLRSRHARASACTMTSVTPSDGRKHAQSMWTHCAVTADVTDLQSCIASQCSSAQRRIIRDSPRLQLSSLRSTSGKELAIRVRPPSHTPCMTESIANHCQASAHAGHALPQLRITHNPLLRSQ